MTSAIRKLYLLLVMPVLMLLAQHGAAWHEIVHLHQQPPPHERYAQHGDDPANAQCEACLAFSHVAAAMAGGVAALLPCSFGHARPAVSAVALRAAAAPAPRSCGPPVFL